VNEVPSFRNGITELGPVFVATALLLVAISHIAVAENTREIPQEQEEWLRLVDPLITAEERDYFLSLQEEFRRQAFVEEFWRVRDPHPETSRNELQDTWLDRVNEALEQFGSLDDARARFLLLNGAPGRWILPDGRSIDRCFDRDGELEIWFYGGSDRTPERFVVFLYRPLFPPEAVYRLWLLDDRLAPHRRFGLPTTNPSLFCDSRTRRWAMQEVAYDPVHYRNLMAELTSLPEPRSREWVATFASYSTAIPQEADIFEVELSVDFPGRNQSRAAVRGLVGVPSHVPDCRALKGQAVCQLQLTGEIVRDGRLFEQFRYRFEVPARDTTEVLPLIFQRYLRPGAVRLLLKVEDLLGGRFAHLDRTIQVPHPNDLTSLRTQPDSELFARLDEANQAARRGQTTIRILPPPDTEIQVGPLRVSTVATGDVSQVTFFVDNRPVLTKRQPPFSVELNLGNTAASHRLRAVALDEDGQERASDEIMINQGGQRFRVRLIEPRADRAYESSLSVVAEVEVPEDQDLDRVEVYLDEQRMATLYQEPFVQPLLLPGPEMAYIRVVGYLADGNTTEDIVFINAPDHFEHLEVQFVELYTTVVGSDGRPVAGLTAEDFTVFEDDEIQRIRRFEYVQDLPIHSGLLIDTSGSMEDALPRVADAAVAFAQEAMKPRDRVAVFSFANRPTVEKGFTNDLDEIEMALWGLRAEGSTAIYDSLVFALNYFGGIKGPKALLLLSDGRDEASSFDFEGALSVAHRIGMTVYVIGLRDLSSDRPARRLLRQIARETGGRSFFIDSLEELPEIYRTIQEELRSQYLIAYQSSSSKDPAQLRLVRVEVDDRGAEVRTLSGYYP
jgi:VWFA-related protein